MTTNPALTPDEQNTLAVLIKRGVAFFLKRKQAGQSDEQAACGALQDVLRRDMELLAIATGPRPESVAFRRTLSAYVWSAARVDVRAEDSRRRETDGQRADTFEVARMLQEISQ